MPILYEKSGRVATITINRPDQMNAIDAATTAALRAVVERFEQDEQAWVGIITGAGAAPSAPGWTSRRS